MNATMSDLTEPIHAVLDRLSVQELLEKVPQDVREHLPERLRPEPRSHRRLWMTILVLVGVGAIVMLVKRSTASQGHGAHDHAAHDHALHDMPGVAAVDRAETSGATIP